MNVVSDMSVDTLAHGNIGCVSEIKFNNKTLRVKKHQWNVILFDSLIQVAVVTRLTACVRSYNQILSQSVMCLASKYQRHAGMGCTSLQQGLG